VLMVGVGGGLIRAGTHIHTQNVGGGETHESAPMTPSGGVMMSAQCTWLGATVGVRAVLASASID
jgi:hypothetical protein